MRAAITDEAAPAVLTRHSISDQHRSPHGSARMNHTTEPTRQAVDSLDGLTLLEFGASWCPHCQAAQPLIAALVKAHPGLRHLRIEDGSGRPLGRSFRV